MKNWPEMTEEQKMLLEMVTDFSKKELAPKAAEFEKEKKISDSLKNQLAQMGLLGMMVPERFGGGGMDCVSYVLAMEALSAACASTGVFVSVNNSLVCEPLLKFGSEEQKKRFLIPLAQGKKIGCFALSEPGHGSDPAGLECRAEKVSGGYRIRGTKNWITNGKEADLCLVFATLAPAKKHKGMSAFIVDTQTKGYQVAKLEDKLGICASSTAQLFFDDVFVPEENRLGAQGEGFKIAMWTLDGGRIGIAAQALGIAQAALEESRKFALEREQFGAPLAKLQAIQFYLAEMATRIQAARLLVWHAAREKDLKNPYGKAAAMAKLYASETAMWVTTKAIQVHGGYGYTKDYSVERYFRDAKITEIYEGTSEIQKLVIARYLLKEI